MLSCQGAGCAAIILFVISSCDGGGGELSCLQIPRDWGCGRRTAGLSVSGVASPIKKDGPNRVEATSKSFVPLHFIWSMWELPFIFVSHGMMGRFTGHTRRLGALAWSCGGLRCWRRKARTGTQQGRCQDRGRGKRIRMGRKLPGCAGNVSAQGTCQLRSYEVLRVLVGASHPTVPTTRSTRALSRRSFAQEKMLPVTTLRRSGGEQQQGGSSVSQQASPL